MELNIVLKNINSRIRQNGLSPKEILLRRDVMSNNTINIDDERILETQASNRAKSSQYTQKTKLKTHKKTPSQSFRIGDLVFLRDGLDKNHPRDLYIIEEIKDDQNRPVFIIRKLRSSLRLRLYKVFQDEIILAPQHYVDLYHEEYMNEDKQETSQLNSRPIRKAAVKARDAIKECVKQLEVKCVDKIGSHGLSKVKADRPTRQTPSKTHAVSMLRPISKKNSFKYGWITEDQTIDDYDPVIHFHHDIDPIYIEEAFSETSNSSINDPYEAPSHVYDCVDDEVLSSDSSTKVQDPSWNHSPKQNELLECLHTDDDVDQLMTDALDPRQLSTHHSSISDNDGILDSEVGRSHVQHSLIDKSKIFNNGHFDPPSNLDDLAAKSHPSSPTNAQVPSTTRVPFPLHPAEVALHDVTNVSRVLDQAVTCLDPVDVVPLGADAPVVVLSEDGKPYPALRSRRNVPRPSNYSQYHSSGTF